MSFAVRVITPFEASRRIHSRIDIVVLFGTAFDTVCTPLKRFDLEQIIFICVKLPSFFLWEDAVRHASVKYINNKRIQYYYS
jgi:hypothetical protein